MLGTPCRYSVMITLITIVHLSLPFPNAKSPAFKKKNPSFKDKLRKLLAGLLSLVKAVMESNAYKDLLNKGYLEYPSTKHSVSSLRLGPGLSVFFRSAID